MTMDSVSAILDSSLLVAPVPAPPPRARPARPALSRHFAAEWLALSAALVVVGAMTGYALLNMRHAVDATERDRLQVQGRVVDDNIGQQLAGMNRALASVRDDALAAQSPAGAASLSLRMKALSDAIPGVRSMAVVDADGIVLASSVHTLLGRNFSGREYFHAARSGRDPAVLYLASPFKTSLGSYTIVFSRAVVTPNGAFAGAIIAALEPEYFEVLLRSVLYAPDMWVSLGDSDGKTFVAMPHGAIRADADWRGAVPLARDPADASASRVVLGAIGGSGEQRMTALRNLSPPALHMDRPLLVAVSRSEPEVYRQWRREALEYAIFLSVLAAAGAVALRQGQRRRQAVARLEAEAMRERQQSTERLQLALQGADMGLWDWDLREDR
ncbi:MAG: hypothetical protein M3Z29_02410, partial [Pseudomonadota bacterium]|nr:hypothetical protein [Pseudomonadota bacterium]